MTIGDIYQTRVEYTDGWGEEMVLRVFWEVITQGSINAPAINAALQARFVDDMRDIMNTATTITQFQTINGMNNADNEETTVSLAGTSATATKMAPHLSAAIRIPRQTPGQRHAYHHIGGVVSVFDSGMKFSSTLQTAIGVVADELSSDWSLASGTLRPVQLTGGFKLGVSPTRARYLNVGAQVCRWPVALDRRKQFDWQST